MGNHDGIRAGVAAREGHQAATIEAAVRPRRSGRVDAPSRRRHVSPTNGHSLRSKLDITMRAHFARLIAFTTLGTVAVPACATQKPASPTAPAAPHRGRPQDTQVWEPLPALVTPRQTSSAPPPDAILPFDRSSPRSR